MLEVDYVGLKMKNPVIVASATPTINLRAIERAAASGAGAVVTKSAIFLDEKGQRAGGHPRPAFMVVNRGETFDRKLADEGAYQTLFRAGEPYPTPDELAEIVAQVKKTIDIPVIASVCGPPNDYEKWRQLAIIMEQAGADAIELNMHCMPVIKYTDPEIVATVKRAVKKVPVICKLMVPWENPLEVGPKIEQAGADAIAAIGTYAMNGMEVDVDTGKILMQSSYYGLGGTWLRPVSLAFVSRLASVVKIPISGVTGVQTWRDAVKYLMLGATTVQVCGALYSDGYKVIGNIVNGIAEFMENKGYWSIGDFQGTVKPEGAVSDPSIRACMDKDGCVGCGDCAEVCFYEAIEFRAEPARIDPTICDGCGVCVTVCPLKAIKLNRVKIDREKCQGCGLCVSICPSKVLAMKGD